MSDTPTITDQATREEVAEVIANFKQGQSADGIVMLDAAAKVETLISQGAQITKPLLLGDDLLFVQPDGTIIGLLEGAKAASVLKIEGLTIPLENIVAVALPQGEWNSVADAIEVDLDVLSAPAPRELNGSGEQEQVLAGDPLIGLPISPLLPPTDYTFPELRDREVGDGGVGESDIQFGGAGSVTVMETDGALSINLSEFVVVTAGGAADGEEITNVVVTLPGVPIGTTANFGSFTSDGDTQTFTFEGTLDEYEALVIVFPVDFSTDSRSDIAPGDLTGTITASSNFVGDAEFDFPLRLLPEGDLDFLGEGVLRQPETDAPVVFVLADALTPEATDNDGSEAVDSVSLELNGLPPGAAISTDGGLTFSPVGPNYMFSGSLADYEQLQLQLPADFSTTNPATDIIGTLSATTDEGANRTSSFELIVEATPDVAIAPPPTITVEEDGDGIDGGGVTVDLQLDIVQEDADGSETDTTIEIAFTDLPSGVTFSTGTFDPTNSIWTGSIADANALVLQMPGDYSGRFTSVITATNVEGSVTETQEVIVTPTGDVDISVSEVLAAETDAPVVIAPALDWDVSISDTDGNFPLETLETVTLTLNDLPAGVAVQNVPGTTFTYDPVGGGTLTFTGSAVEYNLLRLVFPEDYSTETSGLPGGTITGEISAVSTEGSAGPTPVSLRITPEGDAFIDVLPFDNLAEEETGQVFSLGQLLNPRATDDDGSESVQTVDVTVTGLPSIGFSLADVSGFPAGATLSIAANGSQTLTARFDIAEFSDVRAAFNAAEITLPADFSTANRSDLSSGTSLPIEVTASLTTDEDQDNSVDGPNDGQVTQSAFVNVDFLADIDLTVPLPITAEEDGGVINSSAGVSVPLNIIINITDDDGSETDVPGTPFSATVAIEFTDLPSGTTVSTGTLTGADWVGTVDDARNLEVNFPGNYAGTSFANITVTTPEGSESSPTAIVITPTPDISITGEITTTETDAPLTILLSDFINLAIDPVNEELESLSFTLPGLPAGTVALDGAGAAVGTFTPDGSGTFTFEFDTTTEPSVDPADISLVFPTDFSTVNPDIPLQATFVVVSVQPPFPPNPPVTATIDVIIDSEGDVRVNLLGDADLAETDAPLDFRPADYLEPEATDADGSESVTSVNLTFDTLPTGTVFSTDGVTFTPASSSLNFVGTLAEYNALIIRLPADFSTQVPASVLTGTVIAATDEFGVASNTFDVSVSAEGDLEITGPGALSLTENDAPGNLDVDNTTQDPLDFRLADALTARPDDNDGSETITRVDIELADLPAGTRVSLDDGVSFGPALAAGSLVLTTTSIDAYEDIVIRLPDDFSTQRAEGEITGTVTFSTDEGLLNGDLPNVPLNGGVLSQDVTIEVLPEGDVAISGSDLSFIEDFGSPIDLMLSSSILDIDGSETFVDLTVTFEGLPTNGPTTLSDGTLLSGAPGDNVWTGTALSDLVGLSIANFPEHFSGVVTITTNVVTNETGPTGQSATFVLDVTPVAEPVITLSVNDSEPSVTEVNGGQFAVKEDNSFLLEINASTPDTDGSEALTQVVIENMPAGWLRNGDGAVDLARFEAGRDDVASATMAGDTLTITLNPGVTRFDAALRTVPEADADQDVSTLTGNDLLATVTSVDTAAGLANNSATAQASVDVDVDAVVDDMDLRTRNRSTNENFGNVRLIDAGFTRLQLNDDDGSETFDSVTFTITVNTLSDDFDPADPADLSLNFRGADVGNVVVTRTDSVPGDNQVTFTIEPDAGVTDAEFARAITRMRVEFPQKFSGRATLEGEVSWSETQTGDAEFDLSDNVNSEAFTNVLTVRPLAEATLRAGVFVRNDDFVTSDSPEQVVSTVNARRTDASVTNSNTMTLVESTDDGSGFGQVQAFLRLSASTADLDGSEQLETLVVSNLPTSWIGVSETTENVTLDRSMFFVANGTSIISEAEFDKIDAAIFDAATGTLTLTFVADVTSFDGSVAVYPALYEDYDIDRTNTDPFSSDGDFFGADLNFALTVQDDNTVTVTEVEADLTVDVDVDPVNNQAVVLAFPVGIEGDVDNLPGGPSGIFDFSFTPLIQDMDGSESIEATILRNVPDFLTVYVADPDDPSGPKIPALLTNINGDGTLDWSLDQDQWLNVELRGVPLHFAGTIPIIVDIVTEEANGGTMVTRLDPVDITIEPTADGGDPSETVSTNEDTAIQVEISGNIIDQTPESPEIILNTVEIFDVLPDSEGRVPRFFDGLPDQTGVTPGGDPIYANEILPVVAGSYVLTPSQAENLYVLPGTDSNEDSVFSVRVIYREQIDPTEFTTGEGTITVRVTGVADKPIVEVQDADPDNVGGGLNKDLINAIYRPDDVTDGVPNEDRAYAYAGFDNIAFQLTQRVSDAALQAGFTSPSDPIFTAADPLSGVRDEITFADGLPDGSETIYYLITDVPPGIRFIGGSPVDATGESYLVTGPNLGGLGIDADTVTDVTYYDMTFNTIVLEDDVDLSTVRDVGPTVTLQDVIDDIDATVGGSVTSEEFSVMILPSGGGDPGNPCSPGDPEWLPVPELTLVGTGFEDEANAFQLQITPVPGYWTSIADLASLPNGVSGDFGFGLTLPPGASLSSSPAGAVLFDPVTGSYAIDFSVLGIDPADPTLTQGSIIYTPPPHESSPVNPFPVDDTFGGADPYDNLPDIEFTSVLNNFTCNIFDTTTGTLVTPIAPVVDGPSITIGAPATILEDTLFDADVQITGIDPGERQTGDVVITLSGDPTAQLFGASGLIAPDSGSGTTLTYTLSPDQVAGLQVLPTEHFSGTITMSVQASSEDIDNTVASSTATRDFTIEAVADTPQFVYNPDPTPTETGLPLVTDPTGATPIVTAIEDQNVVLSDVFQVAGSPDQDGSEVEAAVIGPLPPYLELVGVGSSIIDNGDGTFTVSRTDFGTVALRLTDEHARTPDALNSDILAEIPINITLNTLELSNSDEATNDTTFLLRIFPDADKPTVDVTLTPNSGVEDDGSIYTIALSGTTPDPHETIDFELTLPPGSQLFLDGSPITIPPSGVVTVPGIPVGTTTAAGATFEPDGALTFIAAPDFGGDVTLDVVAVSTDTSPAYGYTDTEASDASQVDIAITPSPDLVVSVTDPVVVLPETDAPVSFNPSDNVTLSVTDTDGSEVIDGVTFELAGLPDGTTYSIGGANIPVTGTLSLSGTLADFNALTITLPTDFSTNGSTLSATVTATTNEGGNETVGFDVDVPGELDVLVEANPSDLAQPDGTDLVVDLGLNVQVTDTQAVPSETPETVVVVFDAPLPVGATASDGVLSSDRTTLTFARGGLSPADFTLAIAALALTVPGSFAGDITGVVHAETNHGTSTDEGFAINVNARPEITGPVDFTDVFDTSVTVPFADLLANATDSTAMTVENITSPDPLVGISVLGQDVTITVPAGYVGTPLLEYDVVDSGTVPATSAATATVDFDTMQMQDSGTTITGPDGITRAVMTDVTGDPALETVARGTALDDHVVVDPAGTAFDGVTGFEMMEGSDLVDLSNATRGFDVDGGAGEDILLGSDFADTLTGGTGDDTFVLSAGPITFADVIADFETGDQIDLTAVVNGVDDISGIVDFDNTTGALTISGNTAFDVAASGGGIPTQVEIIFEDSAGAAQTAVI